MGSAKPSPLVSIFSPILTQISALFCRLRPCTVKNKFTLTKALSVDPIYLRYKEMDKAIDYRVSASTDPT